MSFSLTFSLAVQYLNGNITMNSFDIGFHFIQILDLHYQFRAKIQFAAHFTNLWQFIYFVGLCLIFLKISGLYVECQNSQHEQIWPNAVSELINTALGISINWTYWVHFALLKFHHNKFHVKWEWPQLICLGQWVSIIVPILSICIWLICPICCS